MLTRIFRLIEQHHARRRLVVGCMIAAALAAPASAQQPQVVDSAAAVRAPLLREGSTLVEARARLQRHGTQEWWTLILDADSPGLAPTGSTTAGSHPLHELIVLPCSRLMEMERILASAPEPEASNTRFEVSGRVYVFRDRNYFLPTHAAVISAMPAPPPPPPAASAPDAGVPSATTTPAATTPEDDSAEAIARALQQQAGPLARSSGAARQVSGANGVPASQDGAPDAPDTSATGATLHENAAVVNRRGKITRDRSGGWLMVFDADATGLADPPMKLLPCELLEKIEDYARRSGNNSPIILTGQVYVYAGQSHLLPTVYRIPRESSRLTP
ncbi:MAG TPA: hypothetical protein VMS30_06445 [Phycisphaerales bacterium]|nr:hypothetical protein [Phycisphaerales bacterium]